MGQSDDTRWPGQIFAQANMRKSNSGAAGFRLVSCPWEFVIFRLLIYDIYRKFGADMKVTNYLK